jgi:hypothetical protein
MWIALSLLGGLLLAAIVYLLGFDGRFRVERSREIAAPTDRVFATVADLRTWPAWSPWVLHEPDAEIVFGDNCSSEGGYYSWNGEHIGAGRLTHIGLRANSAIAQQIEFTRPFKARHRVAWSFERRGDNTLVSWEMNGRMPLLLRFMAARVEPVIGRDYELGLALLNGFMNADAEHPQLTFDGREQLEDFSYWSIPCHGNLRQLEASRDASLESLQRAAAGKTGLGLTLYQGLDPLAAYYRAEFAIPVASTTPTSNYTRREFHGGAYLRMTLRGDHQFLPLGWHALYSHCRLRRLKTDRTRPALEIYHATPAETTDSNQVTTVLYAPLKI